MSSFHVKRSQIAHLDTLTQYDGIRTTRWERPPQGLAVKEIQTTHRPTDLRKHPDGGAMLKPPYHWHWYQEEYFHITEGRFVFTLEGKDFTVSSDDPQPVRIPVAARHTFAVDTSCKSPCTIEITTAVSPRAPSGQPESAGTTETFFRNLYGYLEDCRVQGVSPSLPQLLLFLDTAEVSLAFRFGPDWLMQPLSYAMGVVLGRWIGAGLLGYSASYPEYYNAKGQRYA